MGEMASTSSKFPTKCVNMNPTTNFELCIKCQKPGGALVRSPQSHQNFIDNVRERAKYGESGYLQIASRVADLTANDLIELDTTWHRECFQETTNVTKIHRAKSRYEKGLKLKDVSSLLTYPEQGGRPSMKISVPSGTSGNDNQPESSSRFTRSSSVALNNSLCFFCNTDKPKETLHEVCSFDVG